MLPCHLQKFIQQKLLSLYESIRRRERVSIRADSPNESHFCWLNVPWLADRRTARGEEPHGPAHPPADAGRTDRRTERPVRGDHRWSPRPGSPALRAHRRRRIPARARSTSCSAPPRSAPRSRSSAPRSAIAPKFTDRMRELAILLVAARWDSAFERESHEAIARAIGFADDELAAIRALDVSGFPGDEAHRRARGRRTARRRPVRRRVGCGIRRSRRRRRLRAHRPRRVLLDARPAAAGVPCRVRLHARGAADTVSLYESR